MTPSTKHCAVAVAQPQTSRRNYSLPTLRNRLSDNTIDLQRASTGQKHRRHPHVHVCNCLLHTTANLRVLLLSLLLMLHVSIRYVQSSVGDLTR